MYCEHRKLWIRPTIDCRRCAWFDCPDHPNGVDEVTMQRILSDCPTYRRAKRRDMPASGKVEWDGLKTTCRRWRWFKGNQAGDPCENCSLPRPCDHRGERGKIELELAQKRAEKRADTNAGRHPEGYEIGYHQPGGARFVLGGFPAANSAHPIITRLREQGFEVGGFTESRRQPRYGRLYEVLRRLVGTDKWELVQYCGQRGRKGYPLKVAQKGAGEWEVKFKQTPLPDDAAWTGRDKT